MSFYLLGVMEADEGREFGPMGIANPYGERALVTAVSFGGVSMLVCRVDDWKLNRNDKRDLLNKILEHQKILEKLMQQSFLLPIKFATLVENEHDVITMLRHYRTPLQESLTKMKPFIEVDVVVVWEVEAMLKQIAQTDGEIKKLRAKVEEIPLEKREGKDLMAIGVRLEEKLEERRKGIEKTIIDELDAVSQDRTNHERLEGKMVVNSSFLVERSRETLFFQKMDKLDQKLDRALKFKCLSPLPPHSFSTVVVEQVSPAELTAAMELFSVAPEMTLKELNSMNRSLTKKYHPDTGKGEKGMFEKVASSYKLLSNLFNGESQPFLNLDKRRCFQLEIRREEMPLNG